jgi:hypothetical protein
MVCGSIREMKVRSLPTAPKKDKMKIKKVRCKSGFMGEQYKLRDAYVGFYDFKAWSEMYNLHTRLGYKTPETAWRYNPTVQSSTVASDYRKVKGA